MPLFLSWLQINNSLVWWREFSALNKKKLSHVNINLHCRKMTDYKPKNFHVLTTHCPAELVQQILAFPVLDKSFIIVYSNVCFEPFWHVLIGKPHFSKPCYLIPIPFWPFQPYHWFVSCHVSSLFWLWGVCDRRLSFTWTTQWMDKYLLIKAGESVWCNMFSQQHHTSQNITAHIIFIGYCLVIIFNGWASNFGQLTKKNNTNQSTNTKYTEGS